jgi:hypothetical protein
MVVCMESTSSFCFKMVLKALQSVSLKLQNLLVGATSISRSSVVNLPHTSDIADYLNVRHSKYVFYSHKQAKDEMLSTPFSDLRDGHWSPTHQHWI